MSTSAGWDTIIVGAGAAGCVLANRLTASGRHKVLVLEAGGPDNRLWIKVPAGFTRTMLDPAVGWGYENAPAPETADRAIPCPRGRVLGGSSSINGHLYVRGQADDYADWVAQGASGWGWNDVLPYFRRAETRAGGDAAVRGVDGPLQVTDPRMQHPLCEAFIDGMQSLGEPRNPDYNRGDQRGAASADFTGDGVADLTVANYGDIDPPPEEQFPDRGNARILSNNGSGVFTPADTLVTGWFPRSLALTDFDGDGLTDIATASGLHPATGTLPDDVIRILRIGAALEARSEHPLAHAIVKGAAAFGIELPDATDFQSTAGKGAEATIEGTRHLVGSERLFLELRAKGPALLAEVSRKLQDNGKTCVWLGSRNGDEVTAIAVLALADTIRPAALHLADDMHRLGVRKVVMLTGDHQLVANAIAREAKVDEVRAQLLPNDKLEIIRELKKEGTVMMVGDGVNDAPALAMADVGVAMGAAGTDVAMETADIVLMGDRLENIPLLLAHARRAKRVLLQNLIFASAVIVVLVAAALGFQLPLPLGVVGHEGSTVLVCLNGLRLLLIGTARP